MFHTTKYTYKFAQLLFVFSLFCSFSIAQIPDGYYNGTQGLYGEELQEALHHIIKDHAPRTYGQLWQDFELTDKKSNGKVWDMYSDVPDGQPPYEYIFFTDQCGNYSQEGDCYNREHTWPTSWYGGNTMPMYSDLFLVVPTDGFVNMRRANYPYGEVSNPSWVAANGGKLGPNTSSGYSGIVFEPIDAYKGDFARGMFYMSVRYFGQGNNWPGSDMTTGSELLPWALALMRQWHEQDPVSEKEISRNNAVFQLQGNRNPFIDHPDFADRIWDEFATVNETKRPVFAVYPNPATGVLFLSFNATAAAQDVKIEVYDPTGRKLKSFAIDGMLSMSFDTHDLPPGIYFIHLLHGNRFVAANKIIKH
jgi:endonuclease I